MAARENLLHNTWHLGLKEFHSLLGDMTMLFLIVFMFSVAVYADAHSKPESLHRAAVAVVDEDRSQLSERIIAALQPPSSSRRPGSASPRWTRAWTPGATPSCSTSRPTSSATCWPAGRR
jgi:hypothetical protein